MQFLIALVSLDAGQVTVPPVRISLRPTTVERALEGFEKLCLQPKFDPRLMAAAAAASSFKYIPVPDFDRDIFHQRRWRAPEAVITLTYIDGSGAGDWLPQCEVTMASATSHTKEMLRGRVKSLLSPYATSEPTFPTGEEGVVEWVDPSSGNTYRIDIAGFHRDGLPTNSTDLIISTFSAEGMRAFNQLRAQWKQRGAAE